ncbi:MAG: hypothetical protein ACOYK6_00050 [Chthoniobacterales bacterium]
MKTLVLTAWTENMEEVVKITSPTKIEYAHKHGYEYSGHVLERKPDEYPAWGKLRLLLDVLPTVDRLLWIDADSFVTNSEISLEQIPHIDGLTASRDWGIDSTLLDFSSAGMILTQKALPLLEAASRKTHWANHPLWDQDGLREAAREFKNLLHVLPRRALNAVPQRLHPFAVEPWQEGDFLCHLTCKSNEERKQFLDHFFAPH